MIEPGDPRQVQEHEGQLKRIPRAIGGHIDGPLVHRLVPPLLERDDRVNALLPHGQIGKPERLCRFFVLPEQLQPRLDATSRLTAALQG